MSADEYVVIICQIVGNADEWAMAYYPDDKRFDDRDECIRYGIEEHDHDDFLIAIIRDKKVVAIAWQHDDLEDPAQVDAIAAAMGLIAEPNDPELTPEQDLRAAVTELLTDAIHLNGCTDDPCTCLLGRLRWAVTCESTERTAA